MPRKDLLKLLLNHSRRPAKQIREITAENIQTFEKNSTMKITPINNNAVIDLFNILFRLSFQIFF